MIPTDAPLVPPGDYLLVRRLENPTIRGRIIVPDHVYKTPSAVAVVVAVGEEPNHDYQCGDHVLLGASVSRTLFLGERGEERLKRVHPSQVLARVRQGAEVANEGPDLARAGIPHWEIEERL